MKSLKAKLAAAPATAPLVSPVVSIKAIHESFNGDLGIGRVRWLMNLPGAPRPVLGGAPGARLLWSRSAVTEYFDRLNREGWPVEEKEAA